MTGMVCVNTVMDENGQFTTFSCCHKQNKTKTLEISVWNGCQSSKVKQQAKH